MTDKDIKSIEVLDFEEAIKELENIVSKLEGNSLTLEESMELYKRGVMLSHHCSQKIEKAQGEIRMLTANLDGNLEEIFFETTGEENGQDDL